MRLIIALALLASTAGAETLHRGRVHQTTADRYQEREQMVCSYEPYRRFITLADGRLALVRIKRCEKTSKQ